jgi:hypothetical protein
MLTERIRTGDWLNRTRLSAYPRILLATSLVIASLMFALGHDMRDAFGEPLGTDFLSFWSASHLLWQGHPEAAYDNATLHAIQQSVAGPDCPLYLWLYPPMALLVVAPLAALPYLLALSVWLGVTLSGFMSAVWRLLPDRRALWHMLAFPPVFITLIHGQNAFLSAALLGWGLILLPRRPWIAGALMGTLIYKPQLGLLLPLALLAGGHWRALLGAGLAVLTLSALSLGLLGAEVWNAFLAKSEYSRLVLEQGLVPWQKMIGSFAAARLLGAPVGLAWTVQALVSLIAAWAVWSVWRGPAPDPVKIATLTAGTLLATPFALDYDATLLGLAIATLTAEGLRQGFREWEISALAAVWCLPFFWRPLAMATHLPLGPATMLLLLWLAVSRARITFQQSRHT